MTCIGNKDLPLHESGNQVWNFSQRANEFFDRYLYYVAYSDEFSGMRFVDIKGTCT